MVDYNGDVRLFNIGSGLERSLNDILTTIEVILNHSVQRIYKPRRVFDVPINVLAINRAAKYLDWQPEVSFEEGVDRFRAWLEGQSA